MAEGQLLAQFPLFWVKGGGCRAPLCRWSVLHLRTALALSKQQLGTWRQSWRGGGLAAHLLQIASIRRASVFPYAEDNQICPSKFSSNVRRIKLMACNEVSVS